MLLSSVVALATASFSQTVMVVDTIANQVKSFTPAASGSWTYNGVVVNSGTYGGAALASLFGMAGNGNRLFVAEGKGGGRVLEFTTAGAFVKTVFTFPSTTSPRLLTFGPDGYLYMSDAFGTTGDCIWKIDVNNNTAAVFISQSAGAFANPHGMAFASDGNLYVADRDTAGAGTSNGRLKAFSSGGMLLNANLATLAQPMGLLWDGLGNRFLVGSGFGGIIRSVTLTGTLGTLVDDVNAAFIDFAVIDGQLYGSRVTNATAPSAQAAGICRVTGTSPGPLVTGTNFTTGCGQLVVIPADTDADGLPDPWEIKWFIQAGEDPVVVAATILARQNGADDADTDGMLNLAEFNGLTNPIVADTDRDGLADGAETATGIWVSSSNTGTQALKPDTDGDGLLDGQENNTGSYVGAEDTGTSPLRADTDADGFNDYLEIARTSNPVLNTSTPGAFSAAPIVSLDATALAAGPLSSWTNSGTVGRTFVADNPATVESLAGVKGVTFSGAETMTGPVAPGNLTGASPRTIQAWIFNPSTSTEETIVGWGRRGGPNGTSCAFLHGTSTAFGAVGHWGTPDMPWGSDAAAIANNVKLGAWTYVVYTYDGTEGRVYSNGTVAYTEVLNSLATVGVDFTSAARPLPIRVAGQNAANGGLAADGQKGSLTIAKLRVHDRVLTGADLGFDDADSDGMKDWYEDFYGLNKALNDAAADPDSDGLTNLQEQAGGTHPAIADSDADGMPDGWEVSHFGNQSATPEGDADLDGTTNLEEYTTTKTLVIARDSEGAVTGLTATAGASDPSNANSQPDTDADGLPDGWEHRYLTDLSSGTGDDPDGDTFPNLAEFMAGSDPGNLTSTPLDTDADGLADAWEKTHFTTLTAQNGTGDPDADGASNEAEETGGSLPNDPASQPDNDTDGLPDGSEMVYFGHLDQNGTTDFDGDTFSDRAEFSAGANPIRSGNTPANVHSTVTVAVATGTALDEWSVTDNVWTKTRTISAGLVDTLTFHQGFFYAVAGAEVVKIDPLSGTRTVLASRPNAGWTDATARDIEVGPDGKLYFTTAFGTAAGQGLFRLNLDGTGFEPFIARSGGTAPNTWELNNSIGMVWQGNDLYVSSRGAYGATNRPIYKFDTGGALVAKFVTNLTGPMGLCLDGQDLVVSGSNDPSAVVSLKIADATVNYTKSGLFSVDVVNILGELHAITFSSGAGGMGSILKAGPKTAMTVVNNNLGATGSDLLVFSAANPDSDGDGLPDAWETSHFGNLEQLPGGDADGDGSSNLTEYRLALDPANGASRFAASSAGNPATGVILTWPSQPGLTFTVRSSPDLSDWTTLEATVPASGSPATTTSWTSGVPSGAMRFFRIELTP